MPISRRGFVSAAGLGPMAASAAALSGKHALAAPSGPRETLDPDDYASSTRAFLKLTGSTGNEVIRKWFTGKIYSYFPGEPVTELFYLDGFYLDRYEVQDDGSHLSTRYEVTIKRHIETGELLEEWDNPFTGRTDTVSNSLGGPQFKIYNDWGFDRPDRARTPERPLELPWMVFGDTAIVTWDIYLRFRNPLQPDEYPEESSGEMLNLVNLTNFVGSLAEIENPNVHNANGLMFWNAVSGWQPWMRMGQRPGTLIYKAIGVKVPEFSAVPEQVFNAAEKAFPGHLSEQVPWREGSYDWFDRSGAKWEDFVQ